MMPPDLALRVRRSESSTLDPDGPAFLSQDACRDLIARARRFARGGGETTFAVYSSWTGYLRWARNRVFATGDERNTIITLTRTSQGASASYRLNQIDDGSLRTAVETTEWFLSSQPAAPWHSVQKYDAPYLRPTIFSDATYNLDAAARSAVAQPLMDIAESGGMLSAGYIQVGAVGLMVDRSDHIERFYPATSAQYSVTTRDPDGTGSGWAGVDQYDWRRIDGAALSRVALDKCRASMNPVAVEPGRYTVILEPQAVADLMRFLAAPDNIERARADTPNATPFSTATAGLTRIGEKIADERVTITSDVMDPDLGALPFNWAAEPYLPATWVERGRLTNLAYDHAYAVRRLGRNDPLLCQESFRMSGGTMTIDEMIASTKRGLRITRFDQLRVVDKRSILLSGYTRDGVWLIENGMITKAAKNFRVTESPLFVLNNIEALGPSVRVFNPGAPLVVPSLKVRDFSFVALADAV